MAASCIQVKLYGIASHFCYGAEAMITQHKPEKEITNGM